MPQTDYGLILNFTFITYLSFVIFYLIFITSLICFLFNNHLWFSWFINKSDFIYSGLNIFIKKLFFNSFYLSVLLKRDIYVNEKKIKEINLMKKHDKKI